jgi:hypothetical protein
MARGEEKGISGRIAVDASAAPAASPGLADATLGDLTKTKADRLAVTEVVPLSTTILEATFADAASQREAVERLRDEYAFRPVASADRQQDAVAALEVRVPDEESARRVVSSLERFGSDGDFRVVSRGAMRGRKMILSDLDADDRDSRKATETTAGAAKPQDSLSQERDKPERAVSSARMDRLQAERSGGALSFGHALSATERVSTRPGEAEDGYQMERARVKDKSGGYGMFDAAGGAAPHAGSAPAAAAAGRPEPNQPTRELSTGASAAGVKTRPAMSSLDGPIPPEQSAQPLAAEQGGRRRAGLGTKEGAAAAVGNVVRLYVRIQPPATAPATAASGSAGYRQR